MDTKERPQRRMSKQAPKKNIRKKKISKKSVKTSIDKFANLKIETNAQTLKTIKGERAKPLTKRTKVKTGRKWFNGQPEDIVVSKLEKALKTGTTRRRACVYAGISENSLSRYCEAHPKFRERIEAWEEHLFLTVDDKIFNAVVNNDREMIKFVAERRDRSRYGANIAVINDNANGILTKERMEEIDKANRAWAEPDFSDDKDSDYEIDG